MSKANNLNNLTDAPIEWYSVKDAARIYSISRATLYNLMKLGAIRSKSIRVQGNIRGRRLIAAESLNRFIESQPD